MVLKLANIE